MADVRSFRGFRYDLGRAGALADLICPPYDVIDPAAREALLAASDFNAVRVELPTADGAVDAHTAAARMLNGWLAGDIVRQDTARGVYLLEQEFTVEGQRHIRRGFLARVRVEEPGTGAVFAHEQTLAGPKADRLKLYHATGFNISPVFGLYPDAENAAVERLRRSVGRQPPLEATVGGVTNRLWAVTDQAATSEVTGLLGPCSIFIADGHHRYETAWQYRSELIASGRLDPADPDAAANFCLIHLVSTADAGLVVRPTHRVIAGTPRRTAAELQHTLTPMFRVVAEFGPDALACWEHVQLAEEQSVFGIISGADRQCFVVSLTSTDLVRAAQPDRSAEWCQLAVSALHEVAVPRLGGTPSFRYHHELDAVLTDLGADEVGVLVPAVSPTHVELIAGARELMPPKSTYFEPKVPTGLVFHSLKRD